MTLQCTKCGSFLDKDADGIYTCSSCLQDIIKIKREIWENENLTQEKKVEDIKEDC